MPPSSVSALAEETRDFAPGIPTGIHSQTGKSTIETVFTLLHTGAKFGAEE